MQTFRDGLSHKHSKYNLKSKSRLAVMKLSSGFNNCTVTNLLSWKSSNPVTSFAPSVIFPLVSWIQRNIGRKWIPHEQGLTGDRGRKSAKPLELVPGKTSWSFWRTMFRAALFSQFFVKRFATPRRVVQDIMWICAVIKKENCFNIKWIKLYYTIYKYFTININNKYFKNVLYIYKYLNI